MKYRRVLIKLSGEALAGEGRDILSTGMLERTARVLKDAAAGGVQAAVVVGAGNIWRGRQGAHSKMEPNTADHMGMLGTVINALAIKDAVNRLGGARAHVLSAMEIGSFTEGYSYELAEELLTRGDIVIFAGGTGSPFFTTDTAAALRGIEIGADIVLMAKNVDGVYDKDPNKYNDATKFDKIKYDEILAKDLKAADAAASALCRSHSMPMIVFELKEPENILRVLSGESIGTYVSN